MWQPWTTVYRCRLALQIYTNELLDINNWAPSQRPGLKYQTRDNPLIRDAFPAALQNVELFEATVALCLSFKAAAQNFRTRMCNWSLYHKGQALSGIRNKINCGLVDEAVILATVFLMIIDVRVD